MWPTLVANKIFKKRLGSTNFIADYPSCKEPLLGIVDFDHNSRSIHNDHKGTQKCKVFVSTWNVGGIAPEEDLNIDDLLETCNDSCDIYILGFQEIVPLKASNVLGSENNDISMKWNSIIREALNKKSHKRRGKDQSDGENLQNKCLNEKEKSAKFCEAPHDDVQCIISKQMVGIFISVWTRRDLCPFIRHPSVSCVGCGIMGCLGNKGSVSVRFQLHETSFCFVCSHLASGGREGDEKYRNSNVTEIFSRTSFPRGPLLDLPRTILDHDHVILLGDLNYRISLPEETTRLLVEKGDWDSLLENDQLKMELMSGNTLRGWHEGAIEFAPTYKYCPNSDIYYGCFYQGKKVEKRRAPAWCDRIVWHGEGLKQVEYTRIESKLSDHRPVKAMFTAEVRVLPKFMKNLQSLFLSERFDQIKTPFEVSTTDDFVRTKRSSFRL
ncbi:type IV inositol polyphosphate 5-phosphatase 9-like [Vigna unguiculata]|uniref:Phosphatidylinositol-bisphosphatase n=1 Tax=Vigna unguiculata TaxID=3917 RepID=A0A4D6L563_VIGUN|nr:type IV inositol polyphosphate 5-phosphatase 9-like [Vigna unguiculata]QCD83651.1 phosphatidylinositol-bisphosphatase [Vigna unguiculata]